MNAETGHRFRFTLSMPRLNLPGSRWRDEVRRAEDLGFSSIAISDHIAGGWAMDPIVAMAIAAETTTSLRVLAMVLCNDFRHPVFVHKAMANLDVFSGGRVEIGLGAGWLRSDYEATGLPFDSPGVRIERLAEAVDVVKGLFEEDPLTYSGSYYRVTNLAGLPRPVQHPRPPLLVGGGGRSVLALAARAADIVGINPRLRGDLDPRSAIEVSEERLRQKLEWIRGASAAAGRHAGALELQMSMVDVRVLHKGVEHRSSSSLAARLPASELASSPMTLHGDVEQCVDSLVELRERYGISYLHLGANADAVAPIVARLSGC